MPAKIDILSPKDGTSASADGLLLVKGQVSDLNAGEYKIEIIVVLESESPVKMRTPLKPSKHPHFTYLNEEPILFTTDEIATITVELWDAKGSKLLDSATVKDVKIQKRPVTVYNPDYITVIDPADNATNVGGGTGSFLFAGYKDGGALEAFIIRRSDSAQWPSSPNQNEYAPEGYDWGFDFNNVDANWRNVRVDVVARYVSDPGNNDKADNVIIN